MFLERNDVGINEKDWLAELKVRKVGYTGEEVGLPHALAWAQIKPGLPDKGVAASLEATRFASGEILAALLDPDRLLRAPCDREKAPSSTRSFWG